MSENSPQENSPKGERRESFISKHFGVLVPVVAALAGFIWLQTPSGRNACLSEEWGPTISPVCREEWVRVEDSEAEDFLKKLLVDLDTTRPEGEIWDQYFRVESDQDLSEERRDFQNSWRSTLHVEAVEALERPNPDRNMFSIDIRRYIHGTKPKPTPYYSGDDVYAIEDNLTFELREISGAVLGLRPTRVLRSNLGAARQPRFKAIEDTAFLWEPETDAETVQPIGADRMVWILCAQRPEGEDSPSQWGRTYMGWVDLSKFRAAEADGEGLGRVWYCVTDD